MFHKIGTFEIVVEGDVIHVHATPQFNLEAVRDYATQMAQAIAGMPGKFAVLAEFETPPIMGPEVEVAMRDTARERAAQGMSVVAFVTPGHEGERIAAGQWHRIYDPLGVPFAIFRDAESARRWLREKMP